MAKPTPGQAGAVAAVAAALALAVTGLRGDEGKKNVDYLDLARVPSACYGHTGSDVHVGRHRTDAECDALLSTDTSARLNGVLRATPGLASRPNQLAAATRLASNIGVSAYARSTVAARFNAGDYRGRCNAFLMWDRVNGRAVKGLADGRARERALCLEDL